MSTQLALNLRLPSHTTFAHFYADEHTALIKYLQTFSEGAGERYVYLQGASGSGRTHLLQAVCWAASQQQRCVFYLPLQEHAEWSPDILEGLESEDILVLDDIDAVVGNKAWEEAIFHLYNRVQLAQKQLLFSAQKKPVEMTFVFPDLQSRLQAALWLPISVLSDKGKLRVLQRHATARGLVLSDEVGQFLLHRLSRDLKKLLNALDQLDKASLAAQRRLTIPFVKMTLKL